MNLYDLVSRPDRAIRHEGGPDAWQRPAVAGHSVSMEQYERWCRHTEPRHTRQDLIRRGYSVHVGFFNPGSMRSMLGLLEDEALVMQANVHTAPDHKDFALMLQRAVATG